MGLQYCIKVSCDGAVELLPWTKDMRLSRLIDCVFIDIVHAILLPPPFLMVCDDSGLVDGKPLNQVASYFYGAHLHGQCIAGDVVILKEVAINSELDVWGLNETEVSYLLRMMESRQIGARLPEELADVQA